MTFVSKAALAAGLSIGALAVATLPASAQRAPGSSPNSSNRGDNDQEQQRQGNDRQRGNIRVSAAFRTPAAAAQTAIQARDAATAEPHVAAAEAAAVSEEEKYYAANIRFDLETLKNNDEGRARALDIMIASPHLPATAAPSVYFVRGTIANRLKKPADAVRFLERARELGSDNADLPLQLAVAYFDSNNLPAGVQAMDRAVQAREAAGQKAPEDWYKFVVSRLYRSGDRANAATWLMRQIQNYPSPSAWRSAILIYMEQSVSQGATLSRGDRIDLYRLVRAAGGLAGESDYFNYSRAAHDSGLPVEAKTVIDEGRAAGKIPAGSGPIQTVYTAASAAARADVPLATLDRQARAAANGRLAAQTADAYLGGKQYNEAIALYEVALQKGGVDVPTVTLHLGIAQALAGNKPAAQATLAKVTTGTQAEIARFWIAFTKAGETPVARPAA